MNEKNHLFSSSVLLFLSPYVCVHLRFGRNPHKKKETRYPVTFLTTSELCMTQTWHVNGFLTECVTMSTLTNGIRPLSNVHAYCL